MLDGAALAAIPAGTYTLAVAATTAFGKAAATQAAFTLKPAGSAPVISLVGPAARTFTISKGLRVATSLVPESICDGAKVRPAMGCQAE